MIDWRMSTPRRVLSGTGSIERLSSVLEAARLERPLLIIDPLVKKSIFGLKIEGFMAFFKCYTFSDFGTNPTFENIHTCLKSVEGFDPDCIVAIGGGSAIDLAKVVGVVMANGGEPEDYFRGKVAEKATAPLIAVPTTCGTGAEGSPFAVIMDPVNIKKRGIESGLMMPDTVILDPESLQSLDSVMVAATVMDTFTHILESHISRRATALTRLISGGLLFSIRNAIEKAVFHRDINALETLLYSAFTARLLYPRTGLSIAHALSHPLGAYTNIHHGLAVVVFLTASLDFNIPACKPYILEAEAAMGLTRENISLLSWISDIIERSGMVNEISRSLKAHDIPVEKIALDALKSSNIPSNPRPIQIDDVCEIIEKSFAFFRAKD